jgi:adenine-specific DNA-methyltransferase
MDKLKMSSKDITQENIEKVADLFPNVIVETKDEKGNITKAIDFELLKQELSNEIVEGNKERYQLTWPGKKEAIVTANTPVNKTLRPVKEESLNWENTENLYIEGDNLKVLKLLQESYLNKIKCIYIDPPYNTGKDFIYKDNFIQEKEEYLEESGQVDEYGNKLFQNTEYNGRYHSDWLTMMYPRLKLARNLLSEDGVIFISIDDNEVHNLRKICDEIFGERNFLEYKMELLLVKLLLKDLLYGHKKN